MNLLTRLHKTFLEDHFLRSLFSLNPELSFKKRLGVLELVKRNIDAMSDEEAGELLVLLADKLKRIPQIPYKVITISHKGYLKYPQTKSETKNRFLRKMERWVNENWNIRERKSFLVFEKDRLNEASENLLLGEFAKSGGRFKFAKESSERELFKELSLFFGGNEFNPFGKILTEWELGFKVGNRYALVLFQVGVNPELVPYANDVLNFIEHDFIHILTFRAMGRMEAERFVSAGIKFAEETKAPKEIIESYLDLRNAVELGASELCKFSQVFFIFGEDPNELKNLAWDLKTRFSGIYPLHFEEGGYGITLAFHLTEFDLEKWEYEGIVNKSTVDYLASLFPISGRFRGEPEGSFIPFLNEAKEPAYLPVNRSLFNLAIQGQMGSGKSVALQYIASCFDLNIFIEKIQSDRGSYGIFVRYFGGNYIPISPEVEVSINPFGRIYQYFKVDTRSLLKSAGLKHPEREFDLLEIEEFEELLTERYLKKLQKELTKSDLLSALEGKNSLIRFKKFFEKLPEDFRWKIKATVNGGHKAYLHTLLSFMVRGGKDEKIDRDKLTLLEKYLDSFYQSLWEKVLKGEENIDREVLIGEFYAFLENTKEKEAEFFLRRLYPFKKGGKYGNLFDAPTSLDLQVENYFFEVRVNDEVLSPIIMLSLMGVVDRVFGSPKNADKTKLLVIDEGWFFLADPLARGYIEEAFRTFRKRGISIALASQNPKDFSAMVGYLPYVGILYLERPEEAKEVYNLSEEDLQLLKGIEKPKAYAYRYSKAFWIFKDREERKQKGIFLLPSYPEFRWIAETDPDFKLLRDKLIKECGSVEKAIEVLAFKDGKCG